MRDPAAPERIGPYVIEATLGRGAMGVVYLARDTRIGRHVALKQIQIRDASFETGAAAAEYFRRLQREAEVCGALQHPNIVALFNVGYERNRISYLAMEYVAGEPLSETIRRKARPLSLDFVARVGGDVLKGLAYAHGKGIVHRDVKPPNILIGHDGTAKIADFGIARPEQSNMTIAGTLMGTPNYMSPEQASGLPATPRSDLFSFGAMIFEMLTGAKPFAGGDVHSILQRIMSAPTPSIRALNPDVPKEYENFVQRLTAKNPEDRFASAEAALDELRRLHGAATPPAAAPAPRPTPVADRRRVAGVLRRPIPPTLFLAVSLSAAAFLLGSVIAIRSMTVRAPSVIIPKPQLEEFARKRAQLRNAAGLYDHARYAESLGVYEAYLARYPNSTAAREGRDRAREALDRASAQKSPRRSKRDKNISPAELLRRLKRAVRGK